MSSVRPEVEPLMRRWMEAKPDRGERFWQFLAEIGGTPLIVAWATGENLGFPVRATTFAGEVFEAAVLLFQQEPPVDLTAVRHEHPDCDIRLLHEVREIHSSPHAFSTAIRLAAQHTLAEDRSGPYVVIAAPDNSEFIVYSPAIFFKHPRWQAGDLCLRRAHRLDEWTPNPQFLASPHVVVFIGDWSEGLRGFALTNKLSV